MRKAIGKKKPNLPSLPTAPNITTETPPTHSIGRYSPACMAGFRHGAVFRLSGGCGMRCFGFIRKNDGISYCFFRQDCCRFRRRCLTEGSLAAVAAILPEKTVRNAAILILNPKHRIPQPPDRRNTAPCREPAMQAGLYLPMRPPLPSKQPHFRPLHQSKPIPSSLQSPHGILMRRRRNYQNQRPFPQLLLHILR